MAPNRRVASGPPKPSIAIALLGIEGAGVPVPPSWLPSGVGVLLVVHGATVISPDASSTSSSFSTDQL